MTLWKRKAYKRKLMTKNIKKKTGKGIEKWKRKLEQNIKELWRRGKEMIKMHEN